jgi:zinc transport system substrate-binding protein
MHFLPLLLLFFSLHTLAGEKPLVVVSVLPQITIVQGITGDLVNTQAMVGKGFNPATYQPSPRQIAGLSHAALYISAGMPFEQSWLPRFHHINPSMPVLDMRKGLGLLPSEDGHGHDGDPHIWTDPALVKIHARHLLETLSQLYPKHRQAFQSNYQQFIAHLDALDKALDITLAPVRDSSFLVYHPAWSYFAHRYGLKQIAVEQEGKEPNPRSLVALAEKARKAHIQFILVQPQHSTRTAGVLANAIGAKLIEIDPLAPDFFTTLTRLATTLAENK